MDVEGKWFMVEDLDLDEAVELFQVKWLPSCRVLFGYYSLVLRFHLPPSSLYCPVQVLS